MINKWKRNSCQLAANPITDFRSQITSPSSQSQQPLPKSTYFVTISVFFVCDKDPDMCSNFGSSPYLFGSKYVVQHEACVGQWAKKDPNKKLAQEGRDKLQLSFPSHSIWLLVEIWDNQPLCLPQIVALRISKTKQRAVPLQIINIPIVFLLTLWRCPNPCFWKSDSFLKIWIVFLATLVALHFTPVSK